MLFTNYPGKWLIGLPVHHPAWPRYCNQCKILAAGCITTKTLSLRVPEDYKDVLVSRGPAPVIDISKPLNLLRERIIIPAVPGTCINFNLTACIKCHLFFVAEKDYKHPDSGGLFEAIQEDWWPNRVLKVSEYATRSQPEGV